MTTEKAITDGELGGPAVECRSRRQMPPDGLMPNARLLIVEDEYLIRLLLEDMLVELGCSIAAVASNLDDGKQAAQTAQIDLAVLDVNIDGEQVFPIADILRDRKIPFIFITGYGARGLPDQYRDSPALQKPFQARDLETALTGVLSNP
jgi:CheY-like chemotaxis protein